MTGAELSGGAVEFPRPVALLPNPGADRDRAYGPAERRIVSRDRFESAAREIRSWPGYAPTPLYRLNGLAVAVGLGSIAYKDESPRFGLGSFKALGGAYGVFRLLAETVRRETGAEVRSADLLAGNHIVSGVTVTCATAGNHGRSVAWGAELFGCRCVVYLPAGVRPAQAEAIAGHGAELVRTGLPYDGAVRHAEGAAERNGWIMVSDVSYSGEPELPRHIMQGYTLIVAEALAQLGDDRPSHVFVPAGVGGLAAAACGHLWETFGRDRPRFVVVEPATAACLLESAAAGRRVRLVESPDTRMSGLACAEPSVPAWEILKTGADFFLSIPDGTAHAAMRRLAEPPQGDGPIVAGESGAAALGGLLGAASEPSMRRVLDLDEAARSLVIGTEGATDPAGYREIVGREPEAVLGR